LADGKPWLIIFAGPNGSGKSSVTDTLRSNPGFPGTYINADEIAKAEGLDDLAAAQKAESLREEALRNRFSFVMETVMSTDGKLDFMKEAKALGYHVHLEYVTTQSSKINLKRVANRVALGGHNVPQDKTVVRYERSMALLPAVLKIADTARVYNNSFEEPVLIAQKMPDGKMKIYAQKAPSKWSPQKLRVLTGRDDAVDILDDENPAPGARTSALDPSAG
jgi:predicted ABC-type ATPase